LHLIVVVVVHVVIVVVVVIVIVLLLITLINHTIAQVKDQMAMTYLSHAFFDMRRNLFLRSLQSSMTNWTRLTCHVGVGFFLKLSFS